MCTSDKYGRPSMSCMIPLALVCIILGGGLVGTWVACYYECERGKIVEYNYYAAIWTGGLAIFSGMLQLLLLCFWNKVLKYIIVFLNIILVLCCLLSGALYSYVTYNEVTMSTASAVPTLGMILSGLQAVLAIFIMCFIMMWNCVLACTSVDPQPKIYNRHGDAAPRAQNGQTRGYEDEFFNHEPSIYQAQGQYQNRPQEVSYGQSDQSNTGTASRYIIPRASVRGSVKDDGYQGNGYQNNGYQSNGGTMVVDGGRPNSGYGVFNGEPRGFYSGSTRYHHSMERRNGAAKQNGGAQQNGSVMQNGTGGRPRQHDSHASNGQVGYDRYGQGVSLLQMHGVAPSRNITDGYY